MQNKNRRESSIKNKQYLKVRQKGTLEGELKSGQRQLETESIDPWKPKKTIFQEGEFGQHGQMLRNGDSKVSIG